MVAPVGAPGDDVFGADDVVLVVPAEDVDVVTVPAGADDAVADRVADEVAGAEVVVSDAAGDDEAASDVVALAGALVVLLTDGAVPASFVLSHALSAAVAMSAVHVIVASFLI